MTAPDALLREALEQALDRMQTAFARITPNGGDEFHTPEGVAQTLWFGMDEIRAALAATPPASAERDAVVEAAKALLAAWDAHYTSAEAQDDAITDAQLALRAAGYALRAAEAR